MNAGLSRRHLLAGVGAAASATVLGRTPDAPWQPRTRAGEVDWVAVRRQFRLDPAAVNLATFFLASQPHPVRDAVEFLSRQLDENPLSVDNLSLPDGPTGWDRVRASLAGYLGGSPDEYALTQNTTIGLGHVYNGLPLRPGQEILVSDRDHVAQVGAAILAAQKRDATVRFITLFDPPESATEDEIASRLRQQITVRTRVVGVTWVQSSTGVRMPVRTLAGVVAEANRNRADEDRCLLIVDGVHGLAAVDEDIPQLGADAVAAGTHKWLCGPRGTGLIWSPRADWGYLQAAVTPVFREDTVAKMTPGTFHAFEHMFALPAAVAFQQSMGRSRVAARIAQLSAQLRDGLAGIPGVQPRTPCDPALSAGITCFDVAGLDGTQVVAGLARRGVRISTSPNPPQYARIGTGITNFPWEIDRTLSAIHAVARQG
jgi:isopenicillin-N epimerase